MRRLWSVLARHLPPQVAVALSDAGWSLPLALYRASGRRLARSQPLYKAGTFRQQLERRRIPGMTAMTERAYFKWHTQEEVSGAGAIVDLGCWLGSTTAALGMGLAANPRRSASSTLIHAYDRFIWEREMDYHSPPTRLGPYQPGDSFRQEFELVVRRWRPRIEVHEGDLLLENWISGPIELLLVDAMKSWDLATHIVCHFYPALIPADGYLIHQDFSHCFTPWIPLISYRLVEYLRPVRDIPRSESVIFRLTRPLPASRLNLSRSSFSEREIEQAFDYWLQALPREKHSGLHSARVLLFYFDGDFERASWLRRSLSESERLGDFHQATLDAVMNRPGT